MLVEKRKAELAVSRAEKVAIAVAYITECINAAPNWRAKDVLVKSMLKMRKEPKKKNSNWKPKEDIRAAAVERAKARNATSAKTATNKWTRWTASEDKFIMEAPIPDKKMSEELHRTISSIHQRRAKLRKLGICL